MKTSSTTLEEIVDMENLREAFLRAARGKTHQARVVEFRQNLDTELLALQREILDNDISLGEFSQFRIFEPKERVIHAPRFRERVLHHAIILKCEWQFERYLIDDVFACRKGKGREAAISRAESFSKRYKWFLKLDVAKYFDSIPHAILLREVTARFRDVRVRRLWEKLVHSYETVEGCGLPIGSLISQYLANGFLAPVDLLIKKTLRIAGYARYMDDMVLWSDDKEQLVEAKKSVENFLGERGLRLNPKWHLQPTSRGVDFLGYRVRPDGVRLSRQSRRRFLRRYAWIEFQLENGNFSERVAAERVLAMLAFVQVAGKEFLPRRLFGATAEKGTGQRATGASIAAAAGTTPRRTAVPPIATGTCRRSATTTSASALPSAQAKTREPLLVGF